MKKASPLALSIAALLVPALAIAGETAELRLTGVISPAACTPEFTGGSVIDYGLIPAASLNSAAQTMLPEKSTTMTISCDAPIKVAFKTRDERAGTAVPDLDTIPGFGEDAKFGLGAVNSTNIGAYSLQIVNASSDVGAAWPLLGNSNGSSWAPFGGDVRHTGLPVAFGDGASGSEPGSHKVITFDLRVVGALDKGDNLPLTDDIPLDGLSTFEMFYI